MYLDTTFDPEGADTEALCRYFAMGMEKVLMMIGAERHRGTDYTAYRDGLLDKVVEFAAYMLVPYLHQSARPIDWKFMWVPYDDSFNVSTDPVATWAAIAGMTGNELAQHLFEVISPTTPKPYVGNSVLAAVYYDPNVPASGPVDRMRLPLAKAYWGISGNDEGQWSSGHVFMRTEFEEKQSVVFSAQCGDTGGWHGHADQSSFFLYAYGDKLVMDWAIVGSYHEPLTEWMKGPEAHSIVLIDGEATPDYTVGNQLNWPLRYLQGGEVDGFIHTDALDFVSMDFVEGLELNPAFPQVDRGKRYVLFFRLPSREAYVVIVDDVILDGSAHVYEWLLQPDDKHRIVKEGPGRFMFEGVPTDGPGFEHSGEVDLKISMIEPTDPAHTIVDDPFNDPRYPNYLRVRSQQDRVRGLFFTVLYPNRKGDAVPQITEIRDGDVIGAQIGEDIVLFNRVRGGFIDTAGVESDGELVGIRIAGGVVQNAVVMGGSTLTVNGASAPFEVPGPRQFP